MTETATNPPGEGVAQSGLSIEQRLANLYGGAKSPSAAAPEPVAEAETPEAPDAEVPEQDAAPSDELTADDLPDEDSQPPSADEFEIVHNGTQHKLDRAKVIELAQKGFDYTAKTEQLAETQKVITATLKQTQQLAQMQAALADDLAVVKAAERSLQPWLNVDWVALATNEPLEYPKYRAQYDQLMQAYHAARGQFEQKANYVQQTGRQVSQSVLQQEKSRLLERVPEWRDQQRFTKDSQEIRDYLVKKGVPEEMADSIDNAVFVDIAYDAARYRRLVQSKAEKSKQMRAAPPTAKPGALGTTQSAEAQRNKQLRNNLKKSGDWRDAAALLARRMK
jgi:hypothetical protein